MPSAPSITIVRCGGIAEHWRKVIERCEIGEAAGVQVLKAEGGNRVLALPGEKGSAGLVVKRWELRTLGARVKSTLKRSRAWRHWKGADRLTKAGVRTAACYAIARSTANDGTALEWLVMDRVPGKTLLRHMAEGDLTVRQEHGLARAAGALVRSLSSKGYHNRDGKPSNLIVSWPAADQPTITVIDCVAIRQQSSFGGEHLRALANLYIEPLGCKCAPRRTLIARALRAFGEPTSQLVGRGGTWPAVRRELWSGISGVIKAHGDPVPKVDPLS